MKTDFYIFISFFIIALVSYLFSTTNLNLFANSYVPLNTTALRISTISSPSNYVLFKTPNNSTLNCSLAITQQQQQTGLMYQESLCPNCCMLFVFQNNDIHSFWMKNTLIPLDEVYLSQSFSVVEVYLNFLPCPLNSTNCPVYTPHSNSVYVMELNAGQANERGLIVGANLTLIK